MSEELTVKVRIHRLSPPCRRSILDAQPIMSKIGTQQLQVLDNWTISGTDAKFETNDMQVPLTLVTRSRLFEMDQNCYVGLLAVPSAVNRT
jgi:hypothetical protein